MQALSQFYLPIHMLFPVPLGYSQSLEESTTTSPLTSKDLDRAPSDREAALASQEGAGLGWKLPQQTQTHPGPQ